MKYLILGVLWCWHGGWLASGQNWGLRDIQGVLRHSRSSWQFFSESKQPLDIQLIWQKTYLLTKFATDNLRFISRMSSFLCLESSSVGIGRSLSHLSTSCPNSLFRYDILVSSFILDVLVLLRICSSSSILASTSSLLTSLLPLRIARDVLLFNAFNLLSISLMVLVSLATLTAHFLHSCLRLSASSSWVEMEMSWSPGAPWSVTPLVSILYWTLWPSTDRWEVTHSTL